VERFDVIGAVASFLCLSPQARPAWGWMSKNLRQRSQADTDSWNELFNTQTGPGAGVFMLSI